MSQFDRFVEEYLEFLWKSSPVRATYAGIHTYDHELDNVDRDFLEEINKKHKEYLRKLEKTEKKGLTDDEYVDWQLLKNSLESEIKSFEEIRFWEKQPFVYAEICIDSLFLLFLREFAPIEVRTAAILSRMRQIPQLLKDGQQNLKDSPEIFTTLTLEIVNGGKKFCKTVVAALGSAVPKLRTELEKTGAQALAAFNDYDTFLREEYLPKSRGEFAIGRDLFNFKLMKNHMLPYNTEEIFEIGKEAKQSTEDDLKNIAQTIDTNKPWWEVVNDIKKRHPQASELLATYQKEMESAKRFVLEKDLVSIPSGEELVVIPTPQFHRPILPYAAYMRPAPFEKQQKGFFYVTPIEENVAKEEQEKILRGHSFHKIPVTALHEGYPGHHLQLVRANQHERKLRRLLRTTVFVEGWALYCEEMMADAGFYSDPRTKLFKLKDQLWRACRVIIDVGLHTKTMDYAQAVDFLVNDAKLERVHAEKEVTRYTFTPTQPLSYMIGKKQILELKKDYQTKLKDEFRLKEFHDKLISFGSIPICLIRAALGI
ncbi:MAG: DUF885 domain-containing protein [candidate division WOR-3 bacterium]|nr:MAG: DUF885 domain-containing protein [candidate division WOR-3 bacterium]